MKKFAVLLLALLLTLIISGCGVNTQSGSAPAATATHMESPTEVMKTEPTNTPKPNAITTEVSKSGIIGGGNQIVATPDTGGGLSPEEQATHEAVFGKANPEGPPVTQTLTTLPTGVILPDGELPTPNIEPEQSGNSDATPQP